MSEVGLGSRRRRQMLRLPPDTRLRCGCVPAALIVLALVAGALSTRGWLWGKPARPAPDAQVPPAVTFAPPTAAPTATLSPLPATPTPPPAATPTVTASATLVPEATHTPQPTATPPPATTTAAGTVTATSPASPTVTATATATAAPPVVIAPAATGVASTGRACDAQMIAAIEDALEAQAQYMRGALPAGDLEKTWGDAAGAAQHQADRMTGYRDEAIAGVEIIDVVWSTGACLAMPQDGWMRVVLGSRWRYDAWLTCAGGARVEGSWEEAFPAEAYALVQEGVDWRIASWLTGAAAIETRWRCP